jgi:hypothetical protein
MPPPERITIRFEFALAADTLEALARLLGHHPDPAPAPAAPIDPDAWATPERVALLRRLAAEGRRFDHIACRMSEMSGFPITAEAVRSYCARHSIRRMPNPILVENGRRLQAYRLARQQPAEPAPNPPDPPTTAAAPVRPPVMRTVSAQPADFEQIRAWAVQRGIPFLSWDQLPAVNRARSRFDLPRFERRAPTARQRAYEPADA